MATVTAPKVCIAILNWNNYDQTLACLESLAALDYPNYHIIVVDNASADESVEHIQQAHPDITLICSETNLGYAGGNELALQQALADGETELFWILNNDSTVRPDTLSQLVSTYQQFGDAIYGGVPLSADSTPDHWMLQLTLWDYVPGSRALYPKKIRGTYQQYFPNSEPQVVPVVSGSTFLIPLTIVRRYGFMDTTFFLYSEESDYCLRLCKLGVKSILVPASVIFHVSGGSHRQEASLRGVIHYYQRRNRLIVLWRHSTRLSYVKQLLYMLYYGVAAGILAFGGRPGKGAESRYSFPAFFDGLLHRTGKRYAPEDYLDIPANVKSKEAS